MSSSVIGYLVLAAGVVTVYRLLTSRSGRIQVRGFRASWSR
ncbi:hypothetical protein ERUR111494_00375 [Erysipelothrix urinaevulpis]|nr:hypothetical protein [Erysipelothrix urinaevulpis]